MNTSVDKNNRRIETTVKVSNEISLSISTSHNKFRKGFLSSVYRQTTKNGFVSFRVMEDSYFSTFTEAPRYSFKTLEKLHSAMLGSLEIDSLKKWAIEIARETV